MPYKEEKKPLCDIILAAEFVRVRLGKNLTKETEAALVDIKQKAIYMCSVIDNRQRNYINDTTRKVSSTITI